VSSRGPFAGRAVINAKDNCSPVDKQSLLSAYAPSSTCAAVIRAARTSRKGPRFRFLCEKHLKLPRAEQNAAAGEARSPAAWWGSMGGGGSLRRGSRTEAQGP